MDALTVLRGGPSPASRRRTGLHRQRSVELRGPAGRVRLTLGPLGPASRRTSEALTSTETTPSSESRTEKLGSRGASVSGRVHLPKGCDDVGLVGEVIALRADQALVPDVERE